MQNPPAADLFLFLETEMRPSQWSASWSPSEKVWTPFHGPLQIIGDRLGPFPLNHAPFVQQNNPFTERVHTAKIMGNEHYRLPLFTEFSDLGPAFPLELGVADRKHLIRKEDVRVDKGGDRKPYANVHTTAVGFHRLIDEVAYT